MVVDSSAAGIDARFRLDFPEVVVGAVEDEAIGGRFASELGAAESRFIGTNSLPGSFGGVGRS